MKSHPVAFRYASAMFEHAQESNTLEKIAQDLDLMSQVMQDTNLYNEVFRHPKFSSDEKKRLVKQSFSADVSESSLNLLLLLIDKNREETFVAVVNEFNHLVNEARGVSEATVYSAKPLTGEEEAAIAQIFSAKAGKLKLFINNVVDKDIIGGLKVRIGDRVYDGSVANQLERLHQRMMYGNVSR